MCPLSTPEIITGVSLMLLFVMAQNFGIGGEGGIFGWTTLLVAHITFNVPYVIFNVGPKLRQLDPSLYNAALDLAARRGRPSSRSLCRSFPRPFCRRS